MHAFAPAPQRTPGLKVMCVDSVRRGIETMDSLLQDLHLYDSEKRITKYLIKLPSRRHF